MENNPQKGGHRGARLSRTFYVRRSSPHASLVHAATLAAGCGLTVDDLTDLLRLLDNP